mmetsp:Transcript_41095/g.46697  ORF Transcript_41095/g.46697 Transcript_41095/m.46697 type:complete len:379 (+) Transcript_41095:75-1211(+)|eukprot:CAMPEP_0194154282 /NCGR_PEP_ID=MMETSP0152-20130528/60000_1 /TAXON_ID=1049557 /ORGANISM="Thalassiothrix antarctica, Strain L6-D1" /LENGTH=378 /DNA_ID=CAMNT_0038860251 /DNA_START=135 /DNA_END=1271 /DNA_ORIENTATION=-
MKITITISLLSLFLSEEVMATGKVRGLKSDTKSPPKKEGRKDKKDHKNGGKLIKVPMSPPLPGVRNDGPTPKVIIGQALDYPPYTGLSDDLGITGFGPDILKGLEGVCDIDVILVEASWSDCWSDGKIQKGLLDGYYHGCSTYTHTKGIRSRYLEFSSPILKTNKAAGILTRLENGKPVIDGSSNLSGVKVGDVVGWAPTSDVLAESTNHCTNEKFSREAKIISPTDANGNVLDGNDAALRILLDGTVDALWIYADQAESYASACSKNSDQVWDCSIWSKFKTDFVYVQTGIYDYMVAGTTLAISKMGSGLSDTLNPCIESFLQTEEYKMLCEKYDLMSECFTNDYFSSDSNANKVEPYSLPTGELTTSCSDGYCPCN